MAGPGCPALGCQAPGYRLADVSTTSWTKYPPLEPWYHQKYRFPSEPMLAMFSMPSFMVTAGLPGPTKGDPCKIDPGVKR